LNTVVSYVTHIPLPDEKSAEIVAKTLNVDPEFTNEIQRTISVVKNTVKLEYVLKAGYIKYLKKSIKAMYENIELVLRTMRDFSNN